MEGRWYKIPKNVFTLVLDDPYVFKMDLNCKMQVPTTAFYIGYAAGHGQKNVFAVESFFCFVWHLYPQFNLEGAFIYDVTQF